MFDMALNSPPKALQRRGRFRERSPGDPEETKSEPPEGVADAWSLEDWGRTAEDLVKEAGVAPVAQEFVALSDLRHALEPLIASHMEQMTSWVVAEMAFARDGFKEDMKRSLEEVADHHRIEVNSIRGVCTSLSAAIVESAAAQPRFTAGQLTAESVAKRLDRVDAELRVHAEKMEEMRFRVESTFADLEVGMASNQILQETRSSLELARAEFFAGLDAKVRSTTFAEELLSALEMARAEIRNGLATKLDSTAFIDASRSMDARTAAIGKQLDDLGVLRTELRAEMNSLRVDVDARAADSSARLEKVFAGLEADRAWKAELSAWMHGRLDEFGNSLRETGKNMEGLVGWMQETSAWLQQAGAREQVLMQVVTHLAEESSPTLHNLCEATFGS